jgi:hypothetical protein
LHKAVQAHSHHQHPQRPHRPRLHPLHMPQHSQQQQERRAASSTMNKTPAQVLSIVPIQQVHTLCRGCTGNLGGTKHTHRSRGQSVSSTVLTDMPLATPAQAAQPHSHIHTFRCVLPNSPPQLPTSRCPNSQHNSNLRVSTTHPQLTPGDPSLTNGRHTHTHTRWWRSATVEGRPHKPLQHRGRHTHKQHTHNCMQRKSTCSTSSCLG